MSFGAFHIDPQELAAVVPDCYAEFRPVVADGLSFFLERLSPPRLAAVFQAQAELPADASLPRRLVLFLHACPALHKIGQVVARNRHLDLELRRHLQELESLEPHTPGEQWRPILERELAPVVEKYRIRVEEQPLAEASVAIVVPLTWCDPADGRRRHGVAKLLKPGIVERLAEDLAILGRLADYLEEKWIAYRLPPLAYRQILDEAADLLTNEVRVPQEQAALRCAADQFEGRSDIQIPQRLPFCTDTMTAMERVFGRKITDPHGLSEWQRPALYYAAVRSLVSDILFSRDESVLFHGDPHAGNLVATRDGRLALLDWSLTGRLTTEDRERMSQILVGALALDLDKVATGVVGLSNEAADEDLVARHVQKAVMGLRWRRPPGPRWVIDLLDNLTRAGVRFPPRLLLFRKAFLTIEGVLADVWPAGLLDETLMAEALVRFAWEWPLRWWKPLHDRDYATHVSSADLLQLMLRPARQLCLVVS
ncbi:MAG TPA: AarF/UbiB family protein [Gemmataceae bacterium]|nr:AarF/UbiB family protein [Gemmataceae bacterium]